MFLICFTLGFDSSEEKKCCVSRAYAVCWVTPNFWENALTAEKKIVKRTSPIDASWQTDGHSSIITWYWQLCPSGLCDTISSYFFCVWWEWEMHLHTTIVTYIGRSWDGWDTWKEWMRGEHRRGTITGHQMQDDQQKVVEGWNPGDIDQASHGTPVLERLREKNVFLDWDDWRRWCWLTGHWGLLEENARCMSK